MFRYHPSNCNCSSNRFQDLYKLGARRFLIGGVPPIGCTPNQIANLENDSSSCVNSTNRLVMRFNNQVKMMVRELNTNLRGSHFVFWDTYDIFFLIINNSSHYGNPLLCYLLIYFDSLFFVAKLISSYRHSPF